MIVHVALKTITSICLNRILFKEKSAWRRMDEHIYKKNEGNFVCHPSTNVFKRNRASRFNDEIQTFPPAP